VGDRDAVLENLPFLSCVMSGHVAVGLVGLGWIDGNQTGAGVGGVRFGGVHVGSTFGFGMRSVAVHACMWACKAVVLFGLRS